MPVELLEENDFSVGTLRIRNVVERVKYLFESNDLFIFFIHGLPDDTISALAELLDDVIFVKDMLFYLVSHFFRGDYEIGSVLKRGLLLCFW